MLKQRFPGSVAVLPPFWAEGPIPPAQLATYFVGRSEEVERLAARWNQRAPARTVILAPARAGKRSLLNASLARTEGVVDVVRIRADRLLPGTPSGLAAAFVHAVGNKAPSPSLRRMERDLAHRVADAPSEVLGAMEEEWSRLPGRPLVILEGAHALEDLPPEALEALDRLAASSRAHFVTLVEHLEPGLQERLPHLLGPEGVRVTRLPPLTRREATDFLRTRFAAARCQPTPEALTLLLEYAGGDPATLQLLGARCHHVLLREGRGRLEEADVADGLYLALESLPPEWTRILGSITGRARDAFVALALLGTPNVAEVGRRIDLDGKNVSVLLARLVARGAPIEKIERGRFRITHRLLAEWVRKEWAEVA